MEIYNLPISDLHAYIASLESERGGEVVLMECDKAGTTVRSITWAELGRMMEQTAKWLQGQGLHEGDKVALHFKNSIELLVLSWTMWSLGLISVPLDIKRDTPEDVQYKIQASGAKCVLTQEKGEENAYGEISVIVFAWEKVAATLVSDEATQWKNTLDHDALILFTSGTTGRPKGALLTLKNLVANADGIKEWFRISQKDCFMVVLPLHHINSTSFCLASLIGEASIAITPAYSASRFWMQVAGTGATFTSIVPTICYDQLAFAKEFDRLKDDVKLNRIQIGSAPVKVSDVEEFLDLYHIPLYQGYGQTETALRVTGVPLGISIHKKLIEENSIGKPMKWAQVSIRTSRGTEAREGEDGELRVKGPIVMKGYIGGETAFDEEGWFLTGDIAYYRMIESEKYYFLTGRIKEIIIKGGVNISPIAVEENLN